MTFSACYMLLGITRTVMRQGFPNKQRFWVDRSGASLEQGTEQHRYKRAIAILLTNLNTIEKCRSMDALDMLFFGTYYKEYDEEDMAFQFNYLAHLKDHENVRTNSELEE